MHTSQIHWKYQHFFTHCFQKNRHAYSKLAYIFRWIVHKVLKTWVKMVLGVTTSQCQKCFYTAVYECVPPLAPPAGGALTSLTVHYYFWYALCHSQLVPWVIVHCDWWPQQPQTWNASSENSNNTQRSGSSTAANTLLNTQRSGSSTAANTLLNTQRSGSSTAANTLLNTQRSGSSTAANTLLNTQRSGSSTAANTLLNTQRSTRFPHTHGLALSMMSLHRLWSSIMFLPSRNEL